MQEKFLIGLDAGTSSIKGILVSNSGRVIAISSREYSVISNNDRCEIDPGIYWQSSVQVIRELISADPSAGGNVVALAMASQGETLICIDQHGKPLCKAIVWLDNRSVKEAGDIVKDIGSTKFHSITGQPEIVPLIPATRILWLRNNEPEIFENTCKFLLVEDFLLYRLTGEIVTDPAISSSTGYMDIRKKTWWPEMLDYLGIGPEKLPSIIPSGHQVGKLTAEASGLTGLSQEIVAVAGGYDHAVGAIGAGNFRKGSVSLTVGTSMAMVITVDQPVMVPSLNLPCQCHATENAWFLQPYGQTAGMVFRWFRDSFCQAEKIISKQTGRDPYDLMTNQAEAVPAGCDGLIMLPHLSGAGSPEYNSNARGVYEGITSGMDKPYFIRAIMESIAFMIRKNLEAFKSTDLKFEKILALGGAAKSKLWNQIISDVTGMPLKSLHVAEAPALGAAILAGTGASVFKNIEEGIGKLVKTSEEFSPAQENTEAYERSYVKYLKLYNGLKEYWNQ